MAHNPLSDPSREHTNIGMLIALFLAIFEVSSGVVTHFTTSEKITTKQLERVADVANAIESKDMDTLRREIALSCQCCQEGKHEKAH